MDRWERDSITTKRAGLLLLVFGAALFRGNLRRDRQRSSGAKNGMVIQIVLAPVYVFFNLILH